MGRYVSPLPSTRSFKIDLKGLSSLIPNSSAWNLRQKDLLQIHVYGPTTEARKRAEDRIHREIPTQTSILDAAATFVRIAATRTPPRIGKQSLYSSEEEKQRMMFRPILFLPSLVRGKLGQFKYTQEDVNALKQGFLFKVLDTRKGSRQNKAICYTKTRAEAETQSKIQNRGLAKVMWGINLANIGAPPISFISKMVQECPHLNELRSLNPIFFDKGTRTISIGNYADSVSYNFKYDVARRATRTTRNTVVNGNARRVKAIVQEYLRTNDKIKTRATAFGLSTSQYNTDALLEGMVDDPNMLGSLGITYDKSTQTLNLDMVSRSF